MTSVENWKNAAASEELQPAIECFLAAIQDISECLASSSDLAGPHLPQLARIRNRLAFEPSLKALEEGCQTLHTELVAYAAKARSSRDLSTENLNQILVLLCQAGDAMALRRDGFSDQFRHFSRSLEQMGQAEDTPEARQTFQEQIDSLGKFVESVCQDNERTFTGVRQQIEDYRAQLSTAIHPDTLDSATGLPKPTELDAQLVIRLATGRTFCILDFTIEEDARILERFGRNCMNEILKLVGTALTCQVRSRDFVCRWGDAGFIVLLDCNFAHAMTRANQISGWLSGAYTIECEGTASVVHVRLAVGIREPEPGDTEKTIVSRLRALE